MNEAVAQAQQEAGDRLLPLREVAKHFPGRNNQWVVRNIIEKGKVTCMKVNHSWYIYENSFHRFLAKATRHAVE